MLCGVSSRKPTRSSDAVLVVASLGLLSVGVFFWPVAEAYHLDHANTYLQPKAERQARELVDYVVYALVALGASGVVLGLKGVVTGR